MWWPQCIQTPSPRKNCRLFLFLIVRGETARQRVAKRREKNEVSRASNRDHGFSWVFEERTSGARVIDMGKRSRKGAYKAITPLYLKVFNHWKKKKNLWPENQKCDSSNSYSIWFNGSIRGGNSLLQKKSITKINLIKLIHFLVCQSIAYQLSELFAESLGLIETL